MKIHNKCFGFSSQDVVVILVKATGFPCFYGSHCQFYFFSWECLEVFILVELWKWLVVMPLLSDTSKLYLCLLVRYVATLFGEIFCRHVSHGFCAALNFLMSVQAFLLDLEMSISENFSSGLFKLLSGYLAER